MAETTPPPDGQESKASGTFTPRDTRRAAEQSFAHSRIVNRLRLALPLLVFFVLVALFVWPMLSASKLKSVVTNSIPNLVVENLNLTGLDANNQPYSLRAAKALQSSDVDNAIDLEKPEGDITLNNGAWLAGQASFGRYNQSSKNLMLNGDVHVYHDQGYQLSTSEVLVDLDQNTAEGDKPIFIQGPFGEIHGSGFYIRNHGNTVVIKGPAKAQLNLQAVPSFGKNGPVLSGKPVSQKQRHP